MIRFTVGDDNYTAYRSGEHKCNPLYVEGEVDGYTTVLGFDSIHYCNIVPVVVRKKSEGYDFKTEEPGLPITEEEYNALDNHYRTYNKEETEIKEHIRSLGCPSSNWTPNAE